MSQNRLLVETHRPISCFPPINTSGVAQTSPWIQMGQGKRVQFAIMQGAWAGGSAAVTLNQAKTNAGGTSKALAFTKYWSCDNLTVAQAGDVLAVTAVVSNTFNLTLANQLTLIEVLNEDLDINNGFGYVQLAIASPGSNADLIAAFAQLYDIFSEGDPTKQVSILT